MSRMGVAATVRVEVLGEWGQVTAGFFGSSLSIERCMLPGDFQIPWMPDGDGVFRESSKATWCWIGGDWGTASPECVVLMCQIQEAMSIGERHIPRGSWVCVDEEYVCSMQPDGSKEWNRGDRSLTAPQFVKRVKNCISGMGLARRLFRPVEQLWIQQLLRSLALVGMLIR